MPACGPRPPPGWSCSAGARSATVSPGSPAMAGTAGGDGLGKVAITYGLNKRQYDVMYAASIVLVLLVQFFQMGGTWLSHAIDHRRRK